MIKKCEYCGKEFKTTNAKRKYCCCQCSNLSKVIDLTGKRFNRLLVLKLDYCKKRTNGGKEYFWLCQCDCGNLISVRGSTLKNNSTQSCGCLQREIAQSVNTIHGKYNTKLHDIYYSMKQRCYNTKNKRYKDYGGRGIIICVDWLNNFMTFYNWAINNGYKEGLTIDRIDVNGNYEPSNCRWITRAEQPKNRRNNIFITYNGKTQIASEWAKELNLSRTTIYRKLKKVK